MFYRQTLSWLTCSALIFSVASSPSPKRNWDVHSGLKSGPGDSIVKRTAESSSLGTCPAPQDIPVRAAKQSPFMPLTAAEIASVSAWLYEPEQNLNLTSSTSTSLVQNDNYIWIIEALFPNKTDVLAYLDKNAAPPQRYARVAINEGGKLEPDVSEYFVSRP